MISFSSTSPGKILSLSGYHCYCCLPKALLLKTDIILQMKQVNRDQSRAPHIPNKAQPDKLSGDVIPRNKAGSGTKNPRSILHLASPSSQTRSNPSHKTLDRSTEKIHAHQTLHPRLRRLAPRLCTIQARSPILPIRPRRANKSRTCRGRREHRR